MELTPPPDLDGDSAMHSSPSASADEMFPDEALPQTTTTPHTLAPDLSPPNSQPQSREPSSLTLGVNANGKRPLSHAQSLLAGVSSASAGGSGSGGNAAGQAAQQQHHDAETGYVWSRAEDKPGFEWKNNRASEEEARALEMIVDKGSQVKSMLPVSVVRGREVLMCWCSEVWRSARC